MAVDAKTPATQAASGGESSAARNGTAHSRMAEVQRARLIVAMTGEAAERGVAEVSVTHVVARAGVSRRTFYELFNDRDDCLLAALDDALERATRRVVEADDPGAGWARRVRTALLAILAFLDAEPAAARLLLLGSLAAGPQALERRERVLAALAAAVDEGRAQTRTGAELPPLTAEGAVGGVASILQAQLTARSAPPAGSLAALAGPLTTMILRPYLGAAAARRESSRLAPPPSTDGAVTSPEDPLQGLQMRLTYRTMRVLAAVAQRPGSSNRRIGEAADMGDQGQVSKLLARLRRLGLVENTGAGAAARGEPNAWRLTPRGAEVNESLVRLEA